MAAEELVNGKGSLVVEPFRAAPLRGCDCPICMAARARKKAAKS